MTPEFRGATSPVDGAYFLSAAAHPVGRYRSASIKKGDPDTGMSSLLRNDVANLADDEAWAGTWSCGSCEMEFIAMRDFVMVVLEGGAEITFSNGATVTVEPGDSVAMPQGMTTRWRVADHYREFVHYSADHSAAVRQRGEEILAPTPPETAS